MKPYDEYVCVYIYICVCVYIYICSFYLILRYFVDGPMFAVNE